MASGVWSYRRGRLPGNDRVGTRWLAGTLACLVTAIVCHSQHVANPDLARSLGGLPIGLNPAEFAGSCGQCSRLEESGGPKPLVHSYAGHYLALVTPRSLSLPLLSFPARTDFARGFFR